MRMFVAIFFAVVSVTSAQHQQEIDPAYLRQYYAQQQAGGAPRATPIFEQQEQPQQYVQQAAPVRSFPRPVVQQQQPAYLQEPQQQARQYQPEQVQYQQPKAQPRPKKPAFVAQPQEESPEDYDPNPSYQFGFDVKDDEFTNYQNRKESREGGVIKGSYSVVDSDGFIRTVSYTADPKEGFKAEVVREPTDIVVKVPEQHPPTEQHQQQVYRQPAPAPKQAPQQYVQQQQPKQSQPQYVQQQQQYSSQQQQLQQQYRQPQQYQQ